MISIGLTSDTIFKAFFDIPASKTRDINAEIPEPVGTTASASAKPCV